VVYYKDLYRNLYKLPVIFIKKLGKLNQNFKYIKVSCFTSNLMIYFTSVLIICMFEL